MKSYVYVSILCHFNSFCFDLISLNAYVSCFVAKQQSFIKYQCNCLGDDHFSDLLNKEIQNEKENMLKVPPPSDGWSLDQTEANCLLSKGTACER